jgi:hypothetical protein
VCGCRQGGWHRRRGADGRSDAPDRGPRRRQLRR